MAHWTSEKIYAIKALQRFAAERAARDADRDSTGPTKPASWRLVADFTADLDPSTRAELVTWLADAALAADPDAAVYGEVPSPATDGAQQVYELPPEPEGPVWTPDGRQLVRIPPPPGHATATWAEPGSSWAAGLRWSALLMAVPYLTTIPPRTEEQE